MLEAVLAARERLVLIREGNDVRTNQKVPRAVPVAELVDTRARLGAPRPPRAASPSASRSATRARPSTSRRSAPGAVVAGRAVELRRRGPPRRARPAERRRRHRRVPRATASRRADQPVIELAELHDFLREPIAHFVRRRLGVRFPSAAESPVVDGAARPDRARPLRRRQSTVRLDAGGGDADEWERARAAPRHARPRRRCGQASLDEVHEVAARWSTAARQLGVRAESLRSVPIDVTLPDGTRVVGVVQDRLDGRPGRGAPDLLLGPTRLPARRLARPGGARSRTSPRSPWRSVSVAKHPTQGSGGGRAARASPPPGDARAACGVAALRGAGGRGRLLPARQRRADAAVPVGQPRPVGAARTRTANWIRFQGGGDGATEFDPARLRRP